MKSKKAKMHPTIIAAIIALIGLIAVQKGVFTSADIRFQRQPFEDKVCPNHLDGGILNLYFSNFNGNRGTDLFVKISSSNNVSFLKNEDIINIPAGQSTSLKFLINESTLKPDRYNSINNFTLVINANYAYNFWKTIKNISCVCKYEKEYSSLVLRESC